ncbi:MAG: hypothetical protein R3E79_24700 [Caldilineaceae bacterium]
MNVPKIEGKRLLLLSFLLVLALFVAACGQDEPEVVVAPGGEDTAAVEQEAVVVEEEATVVEEEVAVDEVDAVATTVETETIVDTDVITEIEVLTQTDVAEVEVVTEVMTDTDVTVDTTSDTETETEIVTEDVDTGQALAIVIITDAAGGQFLGDPVEQRPIFAGDQFVVDERFEPITANEDVVFGNGLDTNLYGEVNEGGVNYLTYNNRVLYRFVGAEGEDWRTPATDLGLSPLTPTGDFGEFAE